MDYFSGKRVLITGATGLIGSHIVDVLMSRKDIEVIALSHNLHKLEEGFQNYLKEPGFQIISQDVSQPFSPEIGPVDLILHAAGPISGNIVKNRPVDVVTPNIIGTRNCLEFLKNQQEKGKAGRLVVFSSATVYANREPVDLRVNEENTEQSDRLDSPAAVYSQSKRMAEVMAMAYSRQYNMDVVIARFSYVYGHTKFLPDTAFYEFIKEACTGRDLLLNQSGLARRDNIYVDDAVKGLLCISEHGTTGQVYNVSSNGELGNFAAIDEMAEWIAKLAGQSCKTEIKVHYKSEPAQKRYPGILLDNSRLKALGWEVQTGIEAGIAQTIKDYISR